MKTQHIPPFRRQPANTSSPPTMPMPPMIGNKHLYRRTGAFLLCSALAIGWSMPTLAVANIVETDNLAVITVEVKEPTAKTNEAFQAVLEKMAAIRSDFSGHADLLRRHPRANTACNSCHTSDKLAKNHSMAIDETDPAASCASCHNLEKAAKMPFHVKAYVSLDAVGGTDKAENLLLAGHQFRADLASTLSGIEYKEAKVSAELAGKGSQGGLYDQRFTHAGGGEVLPAGAVEHLGMQVLALPLAVSDKTKLEAKLEAKVERVRGLAKHLDLLQTIGEEFNDDVAPQVTEVEIKDEYKPPLPLTDSLDRLQAWVNTTYPAAQVSKDETKTNERKLEWKVIGDLTTEIKFEWKDNDKTKIEFKKLPPGDQPLAMQILASLEALAPGNLAKREIKEKVEEQKSLLKETKLELKYKPETLPASALVMLESQVSTLLPEAILTSSGDKKREWEVPGAIKGEIKAEIKDGEAKIECKKLPMAMHQAAILALARVQEAFPAIVNQFSKYEFKFEADTAANKQRLLQGLATIEAQSANGDLLLEIKHKKEDGITVPTQAELIDLARDFGERNGEALRLLKNEIKFEKSLQLKEITTKVTTVADQGADLVFDGVIDIQDYNAVRALIGQPATGDNARYDLNGNGRIDTGDLRAVAALFDCPKGICE